MKEELEEISIPVWWSPGRGMMYNRDCLPIDHPESTYNYIKNVLGLSPEKYGYKSNIQVELISIVKEYKDFKHPIIERLKTILYKLDNAEINLDVDVKRE